MNGNERTAVIESASKIFNLVRNWFQLHPGALISNDAWNKKLSAYGLKPRGDLVFNAGRHQVSFTNAAMIQVLASISLGESTERIAQLLNHLGCGISEIKDGAITSFGMEEGIDEDPLKFKPITRFRIVKECVQALHLLPDHAGRLKSLTEWESTNPDLTIALLSVDNPELWHGTRIEEYFSAFHEGDTSHLDKTDEMPMECFQLGLSSGYEYSDDQIREQLRRAGLLSREASHENGFYEVFFFKALKEAACNNAEAIAIVGAINSATDDHEKSVFADKIIRSFSKHMVLDEYSSDQVADMLSQLEHTQYAKLVDSKFLRIIMLSGPAEDEAMAQSSFYTIEEESLFQDLADEIFRIPITEFGAHHFSGLSDFARLWPKAHLNPPANVNALLHHVMKALEVFQSRRLAGDMLELKEAASTKVGAFVKLASMVSEADYPLLNGLNSQSKALMATNGYNIRQFKSMTLKDKGQVLTFELGM